MSISFASALTQRSEHSTGVCLDRSMGAAIRRARTRLPGGELNPVAIIRVPRERMVGTGIGSSLVHEVGHQGASLLDLVPSQSAPRHCALVNPSPEVSNVTRRRMAGERNARSLKTTQLARLRMNSMMRSVASLCCGLRMNQS